MRAGRINLLCYLCTQSRVLLWKYLSIEVEDLNMESVPACRGGGRLCGGRKAAMARCRRLGSTDMDTILAPGVAPGHV